MSHDVEKRGIALGEKIAELCDREDTGDLTIAYALGTMLGSLIASQGMKERGEAIVTVHRSALEHALHELQRMSEGRDG